MGGKGYISKDIKLKQRVEIIVQAAFEFSLGILWRLHR
jgi:hypothetical protein